MNIFYGGSLELTQDGNGRWVVTTPERRNNAVNSDQQKLLTYIDGLSGGININKYWITTKLDFDDYQEVFAMLEFSEEQLVKLYTMIRNHWAIRKKHNGNFTKQKNKESSENYRKRLKVVEIKSKKHLMFSIQFCVPLLSIIKIKLSKYGYNVPIKLALYSNLVKYNKYFEEIFQMAEKSGETKIIKAAELKAELLEEEAMKSVSASDIAKAELETMKSEVLHTAPAQTEQTKIESLSEIYKDRDDEYKDFISNQLKLLRDEDEHEWAEEDSYLDLPFNISKEEYECLADFGDFSMEDLKDFV